MSNKVKIRVSDPMPTRSVTWQSFWVQRAARSSEPFMRSAAAIITQAGRASCRRASEPVHQEPDPGAGRSSSRRVSTPNRGGPSAVQLALTGIRCAGLACACASPAMLTDRKADSVHHVIGRPHAPWHLHHCSLCRLLVELCRFPPAAHGAAGTATLQLTKLVVFW